MMIQGKPALDAITDQSLAAVRGQRHELPPEVTASAEHAAGIIATQFPGQQETAGRTVMCVVHVIQAMSGRLTRGQAEAIDELTDILALAAEQLTREAAP